MNFFRQMVKTYLKIWRLQKLIFHSFQNIACHFGPKNENGSFEEGGGICTSLTRTEPRFGNVSIYQDSNIKFKRVFSVRQLMLMMAEHLMRHTSATVSQAKTKKTCRSNHESFHVLTYICIYIYLYIFMRDLSSFDIMLLHLKLQTCFVFPGLNNSKFPKTLIKIKRIRIRNIYSHIQNTTTSMHSF